MKKIKYILIAIVIITIVAVVFYFVGGKIDKDANLSGPTNSSTNGVGDKELTEIYTNDIYNFTLKYPKGLVVSTFPSLDETGDVVLISNMGTGNGMQIFISSYDRTEDVLTIEGVKSDLPTLVMVEPKDMVVGKVGGGISFLDSAGNSTTTNRQVWFSAYGWLYQITAPITFDDTLNKVLNSWEFTVK